MGFEALGRLRRMFAVWLVSLATWSIVIKYIDPVLWTLAEEWAGRNPGRAPILWDFWPAAHLLLAALLAWPRRGAWIFGLSVSVLEIGIVVTKVSMFLADPVWSFQRLGWLTNKIFVLATFLALAPILLRRDVRDELRAAGDSLASKPPKAGG